MATVTNAIPGGTVSTLDDTTYPSDAFTPVEGDWLVGIVQASGTAASAPTLIASANGITFTRLPVFATKNVSADRQYVFVAKQLVPASPAPMTVTFNCTQDAATGAIISVARVAGMTLVDTAGVRQSGKVDNVAGGSAPSVVLPAPCLTTNPILFSSHATVQGGSTPPSGMTEQVDAAYATPAQGGGYSSRNSGFTGTTITLGSATNGACSGIALELDASVPVTAFRGWGIPL